MNLGFNDGICGSCAKHEILSLRARLAISDEIVVALEEWQDTGWLNDRKINPLLAEYQKARKE
jgi:hypothetical protein